MEFVNDRQMAASPHCEVVALCDVDDRHLQAAAKLHPGARLYNDFRQSFDKEARNIDSCHVRTVGLELKDAQGRPLSHYQQEFFLLAWREQERRFDTPRPSP
jgi:hypothetical protein